MIAIRTLMLASALALALPASAAPLHGWYLGVGAGAGWQEGTANFNGAAFDTGLNYHPSARFSLSAGYNFGDFRVEVEPNWVNNDAGLSGYAGGTTVLAGMANAVYVYHLDDRWALNAGGGAGVARVSHDVHQISTNGLLLGGNDTNFAWQAIAGITYRFRYNAVLGAEYRYMSTGDTGAVSQGGPVRFDNGSNQIVMATLRWYPFMERDAVAVLAPPPPAPPAPPPPPPPPPPVRTFVVFFDFNKSNVTPQAQEIITEAVLVVKKHGFVRIQVTGHTDTVGSMRYNQALSERRAAAVAASMVSLGVPSQQITTIGKSFTAPLVPTGPSVREPQNRRAVIDLDN